MLPPYVGEITGGYHFRIRRDNSTCCSDILNSLDIREKWLSYITRAVFQVFSDFKKTHNSISREVCIRKSPHEGLDIDVTMLLKWILKKKNGRS
jgi:hypothetical protein